MPQNKEKLGSSWFNTSKVLQAPHFVGNPISSWRPAFQTLLELAKTLITALAGLKEGSTMKRAKELKGDVGYEVVSANT